MNLVASNNNNTKLIVLIWSHHHVIRLLEICDLQRYERVHDVTRYLYQKWLYYSCEDKSLGLQNQLQN